MHNFSLVNTLVGLLPLSTKDLLVDEYQKCWGYKGPQPGILCLHYCTYPSMQQLAFISLLVFVSPFQSPFKTNVSLLLPMPWSCTHARNPPSLLFSLFHHCLQCAFPIHEILLVYSVLYMVFPPQLSAILCGAEVRCFLNTCSTIILTVCSPRRLLFVQVNISLSCPLSCAALRRLLFVQRHCSWTQTRARGLARGHSLFLR